MKWVFALDDAAIRALTRSSPSATGATDVLRDILDMAVGHGAALSHNDVQGPAMEKLAGAWIDRGVVPSPDPARVVEITAPSSPGGLEYDGDLHDICDVHNQTRVPLSSGDFLDSLDSTLRNLWSPTPWLALVDRFCLAAYHGNKPAQQAAMWQAKFDIIGWLGSLLSKVAPPLPSATPPTLVIICEHGGATSGVTPVVDNNVYQNIPDATAAIQSSVLAQGGCNIRVVIADTSAGGQASHGSCRSSHTRMILGPFWGMHLDQGLDSLSNKPRGQDSRVPYSPRQRNSPVSLFAWPTPQGAGRQQLPAGLAATARDVYVRCVLPYVRHHLADAATPAR